MTRDQQFQAWALAVAALAALLAWLIWAETRQPLPPYTPPVPKAGEEPGPPPTEEERERWQYLAKCYQSC